MSDKSKHSEGKPLWYELCGFELCNVIFMIVSVLEKEHILYKIDLQ